MLKSFVIEKNRSTVRNDELVHRLRDCCVSRDEYRLFAAQRAYIATNFVHLLRRGVILAEEAGDASLAEALRANLDDELGIDESGVARAELHHGKWKADYLRSLGLEADLEGFPLLTGTKANVQAFLDLEERGSLYEIAGAILSLENIIPLEYRAAVTARNHLFPEVFCDFEEDSPAVAAAKFKARRYMDDHIVHDAKSHFPDLLTALSAHHADSKAIEQAKRGVAIVNHYRKQFYRGILRAMDFGPSLQRFYTVGA